MLPSEEPTALVPSCCYSLWRPVRKRSSRVPRHPVSTAFAGYAPSSRRPLATRMKLRLEWTARDRGNFAVIHHLLAIMSIYVANSVGEKSLIDSFWVRIAQLRQLVTLNTSTIKYQWLRITYQVSKRTQLTGQTPGRRHFQLSTWEEWAMQWTLNPVQILHHSYRCKYLSCLCYCCLSLQSLAFTIPSYLFGVRWSNWVDSLTVSSVCTWDRNHDDDEPLQFWHIDRDRLIITDDLHLKYDPYISNGLLMHEKASYNSVQYNSLFDPLL